MIFAFGDCVLDLERRELRRGADAVALQPKAFDLLVYLVRNRDRVVGKDELLSVIWSGRAISDSAMTTRINAVRRALGDDGAAQRLVRTYTGKGFRFVGEVREPRGGRPGLSIATVRGDDARELAVAGPLIAVMPLSNLSSDKALDHFADGVAEEIATAVSRIPWLTIAADRSPRTARGGADQIQACRELGATYLVTGSVRMGGRKLRVFVRAIDAQTRVQVWADRVDGSIADTLALQDRVAAQVAGQIEPVVMRLESGHALARPVTEISARGAYLRAFGMASSAQRIPAALALLEQAMAYDSQYAPALGLAANCCMRLSMDQTSPDPARDAGRGVDYARRAVQAAPNNPGVLADAARPLAYAGENIEGTISLMDHALAINPHFARGWYVRGFLNYWSGRLDAGIADVEMAMRLSPRCRFGTPLTAIGNALVFAERFAEAVPKLCRAIQEDRGFPPNYRLLAICYAHLGYLDKARATLTAMPNAAPLALPALEQSYRAMSRVPQHRDLGIWGIRVASGDRRVSPH